MSKRRRLFTFVILVILVVTVLGCLKTYYFRNPLAGVYHFRWTSNMGTFNLGDSLKDSEGLLKQGEFVSDPLFWGPNGYYSERLQMSIVYRGFPDQSDQERLTEIRTSNSKFSVFGIHVGDKIKWTRVQLMLGEYLTKMILYDGIVISFETDDKGVITEIKLRIHNTTKENKSLPGVQY